MRSRAEMKLVAKQNFARYNRVFFMVGVVLLLVTVICQLPTLLVWARMASQYVTLMSKTFSASSLSAGGQQELANEWVKMLNNPSNTISAQTSMLLYLLTLLLGVVPFIGDVGLSHVALMSSTGDQQQLSFKKFLEPLRHFGRWVALYFLIALKVALWSLLLFIPGLIASYRYRQAVYLMLEDPELGLNRALKLSGELMRGYKWRLFILDLSFILWVVLGSFISFFTVISVLDVFLTPYRELTCVQFYRDLRAEHQIEGLEPIAVAL